MPISINIPPDLLDRIDRHAQRRGLSRSHCIVSIVERGLAMDEEWPRFFFEMLLDSAMSAEKKKAM
jgi:metal-responsive CopG/Arc/MetJ family transcriptional regulator